MRDSFDVEPEPPRCRVDSRMPQTEPCPSWCGRVELPYEVARFYHILPMPDGSLYGVPKVLQERYRYRCPTCQPET